MTLKAGTYMILNIQARNIPCICEIFKKCSWRSSWTTLIARTNVTFFLHDLYLVCYGNSRVNIFFSFDDSRPKMTHASLCETQSHFFGTLLQKAVSKLRISAWVHSLSSLAERIFFRAENRERGRTPFFAFPLFNLRCTFCRWIAERKKTKLEIKWIVVLQSGSTILYRSWSGERVAGGILSPSPCVITSDWISSPFPFSRFASDFQLQGVSKRISPRFRKNIRIRILAFMKERESQAYIKTNWSAKNVLGNATAK